MGAASGKPVADDNEGRPAFDVRISRRLVDDLRGKVPARAEAPPSQTRKPTSVGDSEKRAESSSTPQQATPAPTPEPREGYDAPRLPSDGRLQAALQQSVRVGELLLRHEREETDAISHLAQELLDKEYRTPTRELRCSSERAACLQCYTDSAAGPLACTSQVEAFAKCADAALRVCVA